MNCYEKVFSFGTASRLYNEDFSSAELKLRKFLEMAVEDE
jgi:hypothetical protein